MAWPLPVIRSSQDGSKITLFAIILQVECISQPFPVNAIMGQAQGDDYGTETYQVRGILCFCMKEKPILLGDGSFPSALTPAQPGSVGSLLLWATGLFLSKSSFFGTKSKTTLLFIFQLFHPGQRHSNTLAPNLGC